MALSMRCSPFQLRCLPFPSLGSVGAANLLDRVWCGSILAHCASLRSRLFALSGASHDDHTPSFSKVICSSKNRREFLSFFFTFYFRLGTFLSSTREIKRKETHHRKSFSTNLQLSALWSHLLETAICAEHIAAYTFCRRLVVLRQSEASQTILPEPQDNYNAPDSDPSSMIKAQRQ